MTPFSTFQNTQFRYDNIKERGPAVGRIILTDDGTRIASKQPDSSSHGRAMITSNTGFNKGIIEWSMLIASKTGLENNVIGVCSIPASKSAEIRETSNGHSVGYGTLSIFSL